MRGYRRFHTPILRQAVPRKETGRLYRALSLARSIADATKTKSDQAIKRSSERNNKPCTKIWDEFCPNLGDPFSSDLQSSLKRSKEEEEERRERRAAKKKKSRKQEKEGRERREGEEERRNLRRDPTHSKCVSIDC